VSQYSRDQMSKVLRGKLKRDLTFVILKVLPACAVTYLCSRSGAKGGVNRDIVGFLATDVLNNADRVLPRS